MIVDIVEDKKGEDIVLMDLRPDTVIADFFVVATGNSDRQLRALVDYVRDEVKQKTGRIPHATEGTPESGWVLIDYSEVVVHLFTANQREYYDLERLWGAVGSILLSIQ